MTKHPNKENLYLIDFDGTISRIDSFLIFTLFSLKTVSLFRYWISVLFLYPFVSKSYLKEMFFFNFKTLSLIDFNIICYSFYEKWIKKLIRVSFLNFLNEIKENSNVVVVSASISNYLKPWCEEMGFDLISTELEVNNGILTGKFLTPNCNGTEKIKRIEEKYNLDEYNEIHVFGNSKGDLPMLSLGTRKYFKFFN